MGMSATSFRTPLPWSPWTTCEWTRLALRSRTRVAATPICLRVFKPFIKMRCPFVKVAFPSLEPNFSLQLHPPRRLGFDCMTEEGRAHHSNVGRVVWVIEHIEGVQPQRQQWALGPI